MIIYLKKYYIEILLLCFYATVLFICSPLDVTQYNLGDKSIGLVYEAISFDITGRSPFYSCVGWLVTRLPIQDTLSMSIFLSIVPAILTVIFVYKIIMIETNNRYYSIVGSLVLMSSVVYFLQAQKIEPYCFAAFLFVLGYYFVLKKNYWISIVLFGLSISSHLIMTFLWIIFLYNDYIRKRSWIVIAIPGLFYGIMFLCGKLDGMEVIELSYNFLSSWDVFFDRFKYIISSIIFIFSFGIIPIVLLMIKQKGVYFIAGAWCLLNLSTYLFTSTPGVNQMSMMIPFLSIVAGIGMRYVNWDKIVIIGCCLMLIVSVGLFNIRFNDDIGGNTSARLLINDLTMLPNYSKILSQGIHEGKMFSDGYFLIDAVRYCNYVSDKKMQLVDVSDNFTYYVNVLDSKNLYSRLELGLP
jgi:hypothetical protein